MIFETSFLLELRNVGKFHAQARVVEAIDRLASQRQPVAVRHPDLKAELVAGENIFLPARKAAADTDLLQYGLLPFAVPGNERRGNIQ